MTTRGRVVLRWIGWWLIFTCVACQPISLEPLWMNSDEKASTQHQVFQPYQKSSIPRLKDLILQPEFQRFVKQRPYLLGYSEEGDYFAVIWFDIGQDAYRLDVYPTNNEEQVTTFYLPLAEDLTVEGTRIQGKTETEEAVQIVQETIDTGFRIRVPVKPNIFLLNQKIKLEAKQDWWLIPSISPQMFTLSIKNTFGQSWQVLMEPISGIGNQVEPILYLFSVPQQASKWTVMTAWKDGSNRWTPVIQTIDTVKLIPSWSEEQLSKQIHLWLQGPSKIAIRFPKASRPEWYLAVIGEKQHLYQRDSILYQGVVSQFSFFNLQGVPVIQGMPDRLLQGRQPLFQANGKNIQYRLTIFTSTPTEKEQYWLVDVINKQNQVIQTLEWIWNQEEKKVQWMRGGNV